MKPTCLSLIIDAKISVTIISVSDNPPQFFSQYANVNWVQKEIITSGRHLGLSNRNADQEERNHNLNITQGITLLELSKEQSAEADTATCLLGTTDSASKAADKPENEQNKALGCKAQGSGDAQKTDHPHCLDAAASEARWKTPLEKSSVTVTVTATAAGSESSVDNTEKSKRRLEVKAGKENLTKNQEEEESKVTQWASITLGDKETEEKPEKETEKETEKDTEKETEKETGKNTEKETGKENGKNTEKETEKETEKNTEKETERETEERPEREAGEKNGDQSQTHKKGSGRNAASKSKNDDRNNNKSDSTGASSGLPFPVPVSDQSESQEKMKAHQGKPEKSYAGALKGGAANQKEKVIMFPASLIYCSISVR